MMKLWIRIAAGRMSFLMALSLSISVIGVSDVRAEYGDVVINNNSELLGMRPVVFPHWFHRKLYTCKVCHADLGFKFKAGGSGISMVKVMGGEFCGACHNSEIAWGVENCNTCHSGRPGMPNQVLNQVAPIFVAPPVDLPVIAK